MFVLKMGDKNPLAGIDGLVMSEAPICWKFWGSWGSLGNPYIALS
jgi:hypothetical protein